LGVIQKQSISGTIYSYLGVALGFITTGWLFPRMLSTEQVGLLRILVSYSVLFAQFASLGINSVSVKLFPYFRDPDKKHHGYLGLTLLVGLVGFILSTVIYLLLKPLFVANAAGKSTLFTDYFYYVIPLILFTLLFTLFDTYYRVLYNAVKGIVYKEVVQRLLILAAILLYFFKIIDFHWLVILYVLAFISPALFLMGTLIKDKMFYVKPDFAFIDKKLAREMMNVAFFGILASFSGVLVLNIDVIMVNQYLGLAAAGIYTIAFFFGTLILVPSRTMGKISSVVIAEAWKTDDRKTVMDIYRKSSISLSIVGFLLFIGVWGNLDNIFHIVGKDYTAGKYVILFIGLANLSDLFMGVSAHVILNSKYFRWLSYLLFVFAILLIITNLLFIPRFGITGAALASLISKYIYNSLKFFFLYKKFGFQPFSYKHILIVALAFAAWYLSTFIPVINGFVIDLTVRSLAIGILFLVPVYLLRISEDINRKVKQVLARVFVRK
jgi:O-antigen/teichoic acid export membrane protein